MRVLLDENVPQRFRRLLPGHEVFTASYMGWSGKRNGDLLEAMKGEGFHALITYDRALVTQQNQQRAGIGVLVVLLKVKAYRRLQPLAPKVLRALDFLQPGQIVEVSA